MELLQPVELLRITAEHLLELARPQTRAQHGTQRVHDFAVFGGPILRHGDVVHCDRKGPGDQNAKSCVCRTRLPFLTTRST